ncbi:5-formyltetrahydrofolate cyclo-ligase, partial [Candidatus Omnitrophota bacterium]
MTQPLTIKSRQKPLTRIIASLLVITFLISNIAYANPDLNTLRAQSRLDPLRDNEILITHLALQELLMGTGLLTKTGISLTGLNGSLNSMYMSLEDRSDRIMRRSIAFVDYRKKTRRSPAGVIFALNDRRHEDREKAAAPDLFELTYWESERERPVKQGEKPLYEAEGVFGDGDYCTVRPYDDETNRYHGSGQVAAALAALELTPGNRISSFAGRRSPSGKKKAAPAAISAQEKTALLAKLRKTQELKSLRAAYERDLILIAQTKGFAPADRIEAIGFLRFGTKEAVKPLEGILDDDTDVDEVRNAAYSVLIEINEKKAPQYSIVAVQMESLGRAGRLVAIGRLKGAGVQALGPLEEILNSQTSDPLLRRNACLRLAEINPARALEYFGIALRGGQPKHLKTALAAYLTKFHQGDYSVDSEHFRLLLEQGRTEFIRLLEALVKVVDGPNETKIADRALGMLKPGYYRKTRRRSPSGASGSWERRSPSGAAQQKDLFKAFNVGDTVVHVSEGMLRIEEFDEAGQEVKVVRVGSRRVHMSLDRNTDDEVYRARTPEADKLIYRRAYVRCGDAKMAAIQFGYDELRKRAHRNQRLRRVICEHMGVSEYREVAERIRDVLVGPIKNKGKRIRTGDLGEGFVENMRQLFLTIYRKTGEDIVRSAVLRSFKRQNWRDRINPPWPAYVRDVSVKAMGDFPRALRDKYYTIPFDVDQYYRSLLWKHGIGTLFTPGEREALQIGSGIVSLDDYYPPSDKRHNGHEFSKSLLALGGPSERRPTAADKMVADYRERIAKLIPMDSVDMIVSIPGYSIGGNRSAALAQALGDAFGKRVETGKLALEDKTGRDIQETQAEVRGTWKKIKNVAGRFVCTQAKFQKKYTALVVDDSSDSGATLREAQRALCDKTIGKVILLSFGKTAKPEDEARSEIPDEEPSEGQPEGAGPARRRSPSGAADEEMARRELDGFPDLQESVGQLDITYTGVINPGPFTVGEGNRLQFTGGPTPSSIEFRFSDDGNEGLTGLRGANIELNAARREHVKEDVKRYAHFLSTFHTILSQASPLITKEELESHAPIHDYVFLINAIWLMQNASHYGFDTSGYWYKTSAVCIASFFSRMAVSPEMQGIVRERLNLSSLQAEFDGYMSAFRRWSGEDTNRIERRLSQNVDGAALSASIRSFQGSGSPYFISSGQTEAIVAIAEEIIGIRESADRAEERSLMTFGEKTAEVERRISSEPRYLDLRRAFNRVNARFREMDPAGALIYTGQMISRESIPCIGYFKPAPAAEDGRITDCIRPTYIEANNNFGVDDILEGTVQSLHMFDAKRRVLSELQPQEEEYVMLSSSGYFFWRGAVEDVRNASRYGMRRDGLVLYRSAHIVLAALLLQDMNFGNMDAMYEILQGSQLGVEFNSIFRGYQEWSGGDNRLLMRRLTAEVYDMPDTDPRQVIGQVLSLETLSSLWNVQREAMIQIAEEILGVSDTGDGVSQGPEDEGPRDTGPGERGPRRRSPSGVFEEARARIYQETAGIIGRWHKRGIKEIRFFEDSEMTQELRSDLPLGGRGLLDVGGRRAHIWLNTRFGEDDLYEIGLHEVFEIDAIIDSYEKFRAAGRRLNPDDRDRLIELEYYEFLACLGQLRFFEQMGCNIRGHSWLNAALNVLDFLVNLEKNEADIRAIIADTYLVKELDELKAGIDQWCGGKPERFKARVDELFADRDHPYTTWRQDTADRGHIDDGFLPAQGLAIICLAEEVVGIRGQDASGSVRGIYEGVPYEEIENRLRAIGPDAVSYDVRDEKWEGKTLDEAIHALRAKELIEEQVYSTLKVDIDYERGKWAHIREKTRKRRSQAGIPGQSGEESFEDRFLRDTEWLKPGMIREDLVIGVPKEIKLNEERVGLTPEGVRLLKIKGVKRILIEKGAGAGSKARFSDDEYVAAGAEIVGSPEEAWSADLIIKVKEPQEKEYGYLRPDQTVFTYFHLASQESEGLTRALMEKKLGAAVAYETVEVDNKTPLLDPMSEVAGILAAFWTGFYCRYCKGILGQRDAVAEEVREGLREAIPAEFLRNEREGIHKFYPNDPPGEWSLEGRQAVVLGGGVVGSNAALMLARMGAEVMITETRPQRRAELEEMFRSRDLRGVVLDPSQDNRVKAFLRHADAIVTGVYKKGEKAPTLIDDELLRDISGTKNKLIIDVSIDQGGNVAGSESTYYTDPVFVDDYGNLRFCVANMPSIVPRQASLALEEAKLKYALALACGLERAVSERVYPALAGGINIFKGALTSEEVGKAHRIPVNMAGISELRRRSPAGARALGPLTLWNFKSVVSANLDSARENIDAAEERIPNGQSRLIFMELRSIYNRLNEAFSRDGAGNVDFNQISLFTSRLDYNRARLNRIRAEMVDQAVYERLSGVIDAIWNIREAYRTHLLQLEQFRYNARTFYFVAVTTAILAIIALIVGIDIYDIIRNLLQAPAPEEMPLGAAHAAELSLGAVFTGAAFARQLIGERAARETEADTVSEPETSSTRRRSPAGARTVDTADDIRQKGQFVEDAARKICAYAGKRAGYLFIDEAIRDKEIRRLVAGAMREAGYALRREFGFSAGTVNMYIEEVMRRFEDGRPQSVAIMGVTEHPKANLAHDSSLIKTALLTVKYNIDPRNIAVGIAIALSYEDSGDQDALELRQVLDGVEFDGALEEVCGITGDNRLQELIRESYCRMKNLPYTREWNLADSMRRWLRIFLRRRTAIRRNMFELTKMIAPRYCRAKDAAVVERLSETTFYKRADTMLVYQEGLFGLDMMAMVERAITDGKRVVLARIAQHDDLEVAIVQRKLGSGDPRDVTLNIKTGEDAEKLLEKEAKIANLILTPVVGFDASCRRLGAGKGDFRRIAGLISKVVPDNTIPKIGLGYDWEFQRSIPAGKDVVSLDRVFTESGEFRNPDTYFEEDTTNWPETHERRFFREFSVSDHPVLGTKDVLFAGCRTWVDDIEEDRIEGYARELAQTAIEAADRHEQKTGDKAVVGMLSYYTASRTGDEVARHSKPYVRVIDMAFDIVREERPGIKLVGEGSNQFDATVLEDMRIVKTGARPGDPDYEQANVFVLPHMASFEATCDAMERFVAKGGRKDETDVEAASREGFGPANPQLAQNWQDLRTAEEKPWIAFPEYYNVETLDAVAVAVRQGLLRAVLVAPKKEWVNIQTYLETRLTPYRAYDDALFRSAVRFVDPDEIEDNAKEKAIKNSDPDEYRKDKYLRIARTLISNRLRNDRVPDGEPKKYPEEMTADGMAAGKTMYSGKVALESSWLISRGAKGTYDYGLLYLPNEDPEGQLVCYVGCSKVENPNAEQLADMAVRGAQHFGAQTGMKPRVGLIAPSDMPTSKVDEVRGKIDKIDEDLEAIGPVTYKEAVDSGCNVFVFMDITSSNPVYKLTERMTGATALGPVFTGARAPMSVISRGATWLDILYTGAFTAWFALKDRLERDKAKEASKRETQAEHELARAQAVAASEKAFNVLVLNCGSSSVKYQYIDTNTGKVNQYIDDSGNVVKMKGNVKIGPRERFTSHKDAIASILADPRIKPDAIGHRVVHGGEFFRETVVINRDVKSAIKELFDLAPLHNPPNLEGIEACEELLEGVPNVAVFDTAFHSTIPEHAYTYAVPREWYEKYDVRKYGFHGTSHEYVAKKASEIIGKPLEESNLITCHLGNGCSIAKIVNGESDNTTMGLTPLEGLMMGTRVGPIDPGIIPYIADKTGLTVQQIDQVLNKKSGLLGVSGVSNNLKDVQWAARNGNKWARLALEMFACRTAEFIATYWGTMTDGVDGIVFTGGIGENAIFMRGLIKGYLNPMIKDSTRFMVIPTNEELAIAEKTRDLLQVAEAQAPQAPGAAVRRSPSGIDDRAVRWQELLSNQELLKGVDLVLADFDGTLLVKRAMEVADRGMGAIRRLIDDGIIHATLTGRTFSAAKTEKGVGARFGWDRLGLTKENSKYFWLLMSLGAKVRTVTKGFDFGIIDGFDDLDLQGMEYDVAGALEEIASGAGLIKGKGKNEFEIQCGPEAVALELEWLDDDTIARCMREMIAEAEVEIARIYADLPSTPHVIPGPTAIAVYPNIKDRVAAQAIRIAGARKVVVAVDHAGTVDDPGIDRCMLELTVDKIRRFEPSIDWPIELIIVYVGKEPYDNLPKGIYAAPEDGGPDYTFDLYDAIDAAKRARRSPSGISAAEATDMCSTWKELNIIPSYYTKRPNVKPEGQAATGAEYFKSIFAESEVDHTHSFEFEPASLEEADDIMSSDLYRDSNRTFHLRKINIDGEPRVINLASSKVDEIIGDPEGELYQIMKRLEPSNVSLHLGWAAEEVALGVTNDHDEALSPVLDREVLLERIVKNLKTLKDNMKLAGIEAPLLVENLDYHPAGEGADFYGFPGGGAYAHVTEPDFIRDVLRLADVGFLVDFAHMYESAKNAGIDDFMGYVQKIVDKETIRRVPEIHVAISNITGDDLGGDHRPFTTDDEIARDEKEILRYLIQLRQDCGITAPVIVNFETGVQNAEAEVPLFIEELKEVKTAKKRRSPSGGKPAQTAYPREPVGPTVNVFKMPAKSQYRAGEYVAFAGTDTWVDEIGKMDKVQHARIVENLVEAIRRAAEEYERQTGEKAIVAVLSYWTTKQGEDGPERSPDLYGRLVEEAVLIARERYPHIQIVGPGTLQLDAAIYPKTFASKTKSPVPEAFPPNTFVFPTKTAFSAGMGITEFLRGHTAKGSAKKMARNYIKGLERIARSKNSRIAVPEATNPEVLRAVVRFLKKGMGQVTLLASREAVEEACKKKENRDIDIRLILKHAEFIAPVRMDPMDPEGKTFSAQGEEVIQAYMDNSGTASPIRGVRKLFGGKWRKVPFELDYGSAMVANGKADCLIAGKIYDSDHVFLSAQGLIGTVEGSETVSGDYLMVYPGIGAPVRGGAGRDGKVIVADMANKICPNTGRLADIAINMVSDLEQFVQPTEYKVAFIFDQDTYGDSAKVPEAIRLATERLAGRAFVAPKPMLLEDALNQGFNAIVMPDLASSNVSPYKGLQRLAGFEGLAIISGGAAKPVLDVSRGSDVDEIYTSMLLACCGVDKAVKWTLVKSAMKLFEILARTISSNIRMNPLTRIIVAVIQWQPKLEILTEMAAGNTGLGTQYFEDRVEAAREAGRRGEPPAEDEPPAEGAPKRRSPSGARISRTEQDRELSRIADYMQRMIPDQGQVPPIEWRQHIEDNIVSSNVADPRRAQYRRDRWFHRYLHAPASLFKRPHKLPPTFVFKGEVFGGYQGKSSPRFIVVTSSEKGVAITSIFSRTKDADLILAKGGCRWYHVGEDHKIGSIDEKFNGNPSKSMDKLLPEGVRLAEAMSYKSPFWESYFDGGKTIFLADRGADKEEFIRDWAASSMLAGGLMKLYIAGPDVQMGYDEMAWIEDEKANALKEFGMPPTDQLATTSRDPKKYGTFPHEEWMATSIGVVESFIAALSNGDLVRKFDIDLNNLTMAVIGFGDVGSGVIRYLREFHREWFDRIKITLVANIEGAIYNPDGLDKEQLLELIEKRERLGKDFALRDHYQGDFEAIEDTRDAYFVGATIMVPAAKGTIVRSEEDIQRMARADPGKKRPGTKLISEGANNFVAIGQEGEFERNGIVYLCGPVANGGGIYASKEEYFHVLQEGVDSIRANMEARRYHIQGDIADIAIGNAKWLSDQLVIGELGNTIYDIHQAVVERISEERSRLLDDPTADDEAEITRRIGLDIRRGVLRTADNLRVLRIYNVSEMARERIMGQCIDEEAVMQDLDSGDLTRQRAAVYWAGKLRMTGAYDRLVTILKRPTKSGGG